MFAEQPDFELYNKNVVVVMLSIPFKTTVNKFFHYLQMSPVTDANSDTSPTVKRRRQRTSFTTYQLEQMEEVFSSCKYPDPPAREELGARTGLCESRVHVSLIYIMFVATLLFIF